MAILGIGINCRFADLSKLTAFGGIFLATLPIFAIITNSYTIYIYYAKK